MTDNWAIQISPRVGDTLINLRAENGDQMLAVLDWYSQNATTIATALGSGQAQGAVAAAFPGSQNVPQTGQGPWSQPQPAPAPAFAPQQQAAPQGGGFGGPPTKWDLSGPPGPAPQCAHGSMEWRHRTAKSGKEYKGWFCPSKDQSQQCDAQFVR